MSITRLGRSPWCSPLASKPSLSCCRAIVLRLSEPSDLGVFIVALPPRLPNSLFIPLLHVIKGGHFHKQRPSMRVEGEVAATLLASMTEWMDRFLEETEYLLCSSTVPNYYLAKYSHRLVSLVSPYIHITFSEFSGKRMKCSDAYAAIESYLVAASCTQSTTKLKAELGKDSSSLTLIMDEHEEVTDEFRGDEFRGARIWWTSVSHSPPQNSMSFYPHPDFRRYFRLIFHRRHRNLVVGSYLDHILAVGLSS
ncbi:hypothetical protein ZIOFF_057430 [Zingiber officinale]|uniref:AAA-type ATPase N-terminal domain-containing protein n=1 Tax=Zingiber officinale TaxID=94328 RepID=A0A8J5KIG9_ZINOF|nr:hypothetical protein ZIOFF_057430 [Zingiber officinale]